MPIDQKNGFFSIKHHGAVKGVTGSCHELEVKQGDIHQGVLIDCGLFQGAEVSGADGDVDPLKINFPIEHIKALVVTHVHIDHVGRIPYLLAAGFSGPIICSQASAILLPLVLEDALKIGFTRNKRLIDAFLEKIADQIIALDFNRWHTIIPGANKPAKVATKSKPVDDVSLKVKLKEAGHILGSAYVEFSVTKGKNNQRVVFSGDLGPPYTPLLAAPKSPYRADYLVIESTYGDKLHENRRTRIQRLEAIIVSALQDNGVILIPAFSIGRTQELLYEI
jgi:metallo-beta-lactamase family protein